LFVEFFVLNGRCDLERVMLTVPGTIYILPEAYDVDAAPYAVSSYELMEDAATTTSHDDEMPFRLEPVSRHDSSYELRLVVTRALDREVRQLYIG